jgi:uncharacterized protein (TIGR02001 family)
MIKKTVMAGWVVAAFAPALALAQQPSAPASPHTITGNLGIFSQYIFRGLTQTDGKPAIQGGFDYSHTSGLYAGTWLSNISWLKENNSTGAGTAGTYSRGGSVEWDFYGGYKGNFGKSDFSYDVGALYYYYPGDVATGFVKADTLELYGALGWKWLSLKYSHSVNNKTFGVANSSGTYYLDLSANFPVTDQLSLVAHYGQQKYKGDAAPGVSNDSVCGYKDYKLGLSYALPKDFSIGAFYTNTSGAKVACYGSVGEGGVFPSNVAKSTGTVFVQKTF